MRSSQYWVLASFIYGQGMVEDSLIRMAVVLFCLMMAIIMGVRE